ncbi:MAG: TIGR04084 family radical SAM/SPASM domain-containing protein [Candidatus Njordarchaeia archaeon]
MLYFVATTMVCNLNCIYCGNNPDPAIEPLEVTFDLEKLKKFISKDSDATIGFYGGEPLLRIRLIEEIMDKILAKRYIIQTNGIFLNRLKRRYLERFDTILISIDGRKEINDYYRGRGVYDVIMKNMKYIRENGFKGDLIARMAISSKTDIYLDVKYLVELRNPGFDHVHWQLDALWDTPPAQRYGGLNGFKKWVHDSYNPGISKLIDYWIRNMEEKGKVLGIVPFQGIMKTLITGEKTNLRCGAGIDTFAITTSGRILACPIAPEFDFNVVGHIEKNDPRDLPWKVKVGGPCETCEVRDICGGRCLFANKTMLWGMEGFMAVCDTVKHLINELKKVKPKVEKMLNEGKIREEELFYPKYNNTTEIIP